MSSFKISPMEFQRMDTMSDMSVRTKVPHSEIDDNGLLLLPRLKGMGLEAGNHIRVQCMNNDYSQLLHQATFVVVSVRTDERKIMLDDWNERTLNEITYRLARLSEWWSGPDAAAETSSSPAPIAETPKSQKAKAA